MLYYEYLVNNKLPAIFSLKTISLKNKSISWDRNDGDGYYFMSHNCCLIERSSLINADDYNFYFQVGLDYSVYRLDQGLDHKSHKKQYSIFNLNFSFDNILCKTCWFDEYFRQLSKYIRYALLTIVSYIK